jgi:hypothetical protein
MNEQVSLHERQIAGSLLIAGTVLFFAGLCVLLLGANFMADLDSSLQQHLVNVSQHADSWKLGWALMIGGVTATVLGLAVLTTLLREAGNRTLSRLGLIMFLLGAVVWLPNMAFSLSEAIWAGQGVITGPGSTVLSFYEILVDWGSMLLSVYTVFAFVSMAAYGVAIARTALLPRWVGWATVLWSVVWLGMFFLTLNAIPALHQFMPLLIGFSLLLARRPVAVSPGDQERTTANKVLGAVARD